MTEDLDIVSRVQLGDRNAFAQLVRKYQVKVRGYCTQMLSDRSLAEDAAQEIFVKAFQSLGRFRADSSFSTWLYRITANHCTDLLRRSTRGKTESLDALLEREGDKLRVILSNKENPERKTEQRELITKILSLLREDHRQILILREAHELSYDQISQVLDCSIDAVKARLKRARNDLREKLRHFLSSSVVETQGVANETL